MTILYRSLLLLALIAAMPSSPIAANDGGPRLHLDASHGVSVDGEEVTAWADDASWRAVVPEGYDRPRFIAKAKEIGGRPCIAFAGRDLLAITGQVLPKDVFEITVIAVARMEMPSSVGIFSIREGTNPVIQLDTDVHGSARLGIVRDESGKAASSIEAPHKRLLGRLDWRTAARRRRHFNHASHVARQDDLLSRRGQ